MAEAQSIDVPDGGYMALPGGPGWDDRFPATSPASTATSGTPRELIEEARWM